MRFPTYPLTPTSALAAALLLASSAAAFAPIWLGSSSDLKPIVAQEGGVTNGTFQQLLDHDDPALGTFTQHYVFNADFWAGAGAPVIFLTPGEQPLAGFAHNAMNDSFLAMFAQKTGAAVIIIEHRFWGDSSPYPELSTENMKYLTLKNSIADLTYFANNVDLVFDPNRTSTPDNAPWILIGCSYSGALAAWTEAVDPGTFWAYQASSAVVEAIEDLGEYGGTIKQAMAQNCSADVTRAIDAIDEILLGDNETAKHELKDSFGLADLQHDEDFAAALTGPVSAWQLTRFAAGGNPTFFQWCDYVENQWAGSTEPVPGPEGVGAEKAVAGFAKFMKEVYLFDACDSFGYWPGPNATQCFDTFNETSPLFTDLTPGNTFNRQWMWMLCNEPFEWWQGRGHNTVFSRLVTVDYYKRQCQLTFPTGPDGSTFNLNCGATTDRVNSFTGGWFHTNTTRLSWTVGQWDPWRPATVSSSSRPGGPLASTPEHPVHIVPGASHCSDFSLGNYNANKGAREVMDDEMKVLTQWMQEFYDAHGKKWPGRG